MKKTLPRDKEFNILTNTSYWDFTTYDLIDFNDPTIKNDILLFTIILPTIPNNGEITNIARSAFFIKFQ